MREGKKYRVTCICEKDGRMTRKDTYWKVVSMPDHYRDREGYIVFEELVGKKKSWVIDMKMFPVAHYMKPDGLIEEQRDKWSASPSSWEDLSDVKAPFQIHSIIFRPTNKKFHIAPKRAVKWRKRKR